MDWGSLTSSKIIRAQQSSREEWRELLNPQNKISSKATHPCPLKNIHAMQPHLFRGKLCRAGVHSHHQHPKVVHAVGASLSLWRAKGISEVPVACFILDTVLALSETLPCPGDGDVPPLG